MKIDAPNRKVIVGPREALLTAGLAMEELNWLGEGELETACKAGERVLVRVRPTRPPKPARLGHHEGKPAIFFDDPEEGVAKGQASVLYSADDGTRVLGGGFIAATIPADERVAV